jgi:hypothetical protein
MTKLFVSDTNIWIDFNHAGLLEELFQLPFELCTTDFAFREIISPSGEELLRLGLQVMALESAQLGEIIKIRQEVRQPSLADVSCFILAQAKKAGLLTGDNNLRKFAAKKIEVRGVLWLLDQLVEHQIIQPRRAALALRTMLDNQSRFPEDECQRRLEAWDA